MEVKELTLNEQCICFPLPMIPTGLLCPPMSLSHQNYTEKVYFYNFIAAREWTRTYAIQNQKLECTCLLDVHVICGLLLNPVRSLYGSLHQNGAYSFKSSFNLFFFCIKIHPQSLDKVWSCILNCRSKAEDTKVQFPIAAFNLALFPQKLICEMIHQRTFIAAIHCSNMLQFLQCCCTSFLLQ